jgi:hypothetical protein
LAVFAVLGQDAQAQKSVRESGGRREVARNGTSGLARESGGRGARTRSSPNITTGSSGTDCDAPDNDLCYKITTGSDISYGLKDIGYFTNRRVDLKPTATVNAAVDNYLNDNGRRLVAKFGAGIFTKYSNTSGTASTTWCGVGTDDKVTANAITTCGPEGFRVCVNIDETDTSGVKTYACATNSGYIEMPFNYITKTAAETAAELEAANTAKTTAEASVTSLTSLVAGITQLDTNIAGVLKKCKSITDGSKDEVMNWLTASSVGGGVSALGGLVGTISGGVAAGKDTTKDGKTAAGGWGVASGIAGMAGGGLALTGTLVIRGKIENTYSNAEECEEETQKLKDSSATVRIIKAYTDCAAPKTWNWSTNTCV